MYDEEKLGKDLKQLAEEAWSRNNAPILLSGVPEGLKRINGEDSVDFRSVLDGKPLKRFIQDTEVRFAYKLVAHPVMKAKVGLIPSGVEYEFPVVPMERQIGRSSIGKDEGLALIYALAKLSDEDLERISIPVSVIVKLFK